MLNSPQAIDRGSAIEEPTLKLLRRLLMAVSIVIIAFVITTTQMCAKVVQSGVTEARILRLGGTRMQISQVRLIRELLFL